MYLGILDILNGGLPKELVNAFDVVHIRAFAVVVKAGDPGAVLTRLCEMLSKLSVPLSFLFIATNLLVS